MASLTVTVTNEKRDFSFDVELPANETAEKLKKDIYEAIGAFAPSVILPEPEKFSLFCSRCNEVIPSENTLEASGVWNGDYLLIRAE